MGFGFRKAAAAAAAAVVLFGVPACGDKKPKEEPLAQQSLDYQALADQGTNIYLVGLGADPKGNRPKQSFLMKQAAKFQDGTVTLMDSLKYGDVVTTTITECESDPLLSLRKVLLKVKIPGQPDKTGGCVVKDGKLHVTDPDGKTLVADYPPGTVSQTAIFRIVTRLPREKGRAYTFSHYLDPGNPEVETAPTDKPFALECKGEETVDINGREVACTAYELTGTRRGMKFFVSPDQTLALMQADQGGTTMTRVSPEDLQSLARTQ